jgi:hypothetical protein
LAFPSRLHSAGGEGLTVHRALGDLGQLLISSRQRISRRAAAGSNNANVVRKGKTT